jgi:hypothetical protein
VGTFHNDRHELHGITVVVDTAGPRVFVGRCDDWNERGVILNDADVHEETAAGPTKAEFLARASRFGVWKKFDRIVVPAGEVASVRRLADIPRDAG